MKTGLKRDIYDKFYTKNKIVKKCISLIKENLNISKNDLIIEPSAGNGSFIKMIKKLSNNYIFFDLKPEHEEIIEQNYLELDYNEFKENYKKIHIIGNPPFGRQSSLAIKFIKKSCEFCNSISFILPKSFKKNSMQKYFNDYFHLIYQMDLPEKSFLFNDIEYTVPCIFQIWKLKNKIRIKPILLQPLSFYFVSKDQKPDISFRRVGVYAGLIDTKYKNKSSQSHYFIKFFNNKKENIQKLQYLSFDTDNTVGPKSISKQELIKEFNYLLN